MQAIVGYQVNVVMGWLMTELNCSDRMLYGSEASGLTYPISRLCFVPILPNIQASLVRNFYMSLNATNVKNH